MKTKKILVQRLKLRRVTETIKIAAVGWGATKISLYVLSEFAGVGL